MDFDTDADATPRPNRRVQQRILEQGAVSRPSFTSPLFTGDASSSSRSSFTASSSITITSLLNVDPPTLDAGTSIGRTSVVLQSGSSISAPISRSTSPQKRCYPSERFDAETTSRKSSRSNSQHSSVTSRSSASDASTGVRRIEFPKNTKESTKRYYNQCCWLCEQPKRKLNIAHVIPKADVEVSNGIPPFSQPHDISNAIPLCVGCHDAFDEKPPGFIILPIDLEWFLQFELADFEDRKRLLQEGRPRQRIVPTAQMYRAHLEQAGRLDAFPSAGVEGVNRTVSSECQGGLYEAYIRTDHLSNTWDTREIVGLFKRGKIWHGSPTALILHAARVLAYPDCGTKWLDEEKLRLIFELRILWGREPELSEGADEESDSSASDRQPSPSPCDSEPDGQNPQGQDDFPDGPPGSKGESVTSETVVGTEGDGSGHDCGKHRSGQTVNAKIENRWQWGPLLTANDIVDFFSRVI